MAWCLMKYRTNVHLTCKVAESDEKTGKFEMTVENIALIRSAVHSDFF
jgi:hypothetical protein